MKVFVNGTFDILHRGHLEMLKYAQQCGSYLLVAIDADQRVKQFKGPDRPFNNQTDRQFFLENLRSVDKVRIFNSDEDLFTLIEQYQPDIMVKGSDYKNKPIIGEEHCKEIRFYEHTGHSTTSFIQRIINR